MSKLLKKLFFASMMIPVCTIIVASADDLGPQFLSCGNEEELFKDELLVKVESTRMTVTKDRIECHLRLAGSNELPERNGYLRFLGLSDGCGEILSSGYHLERNWLGIVDLASALNENRKKEVYLNTFLSDDLGAIRPSKYRFLCDLSKKDIEL